MNEFLLQLRIEIDAKFLHYLLVVDRGTLICPCNALFA